MSARIFAKLGKPALVACVSALVFGGVAATGPAAAAAPKAHSQAPTSDVREVGQATHERSSVDLTARQRRKLERKGDKLDRQGQRQSGQDDATGTPIGGEKTWLGLDDATGGYFAATFVLRGVGEHIEVWVQKDLNYPDGDCRNDGVRNVVTDAQVDSLVQQYDENMLPKESQYFSTAPPRDGTNQQDVGFGAPLWQILGGGDPNYYKGDGDNTVALVSNVRDANYYDPTSPEGATYIAGFFSPLFNEGFDRNVMTIDSYDWKHRTGANPPDEGDHGLCSPKQPARPYLYEGTFAHEYQHLLEYYVDADEETWLNEGLSDYAQTITGYVDTTIPFGETGNDSHVSCFYGWYGDAEFPYCGSENSLTRWGDQGAPSILSDYGAAYSFVTYLENQFGSKAISYLHKNGANGLASVGNYLDGHAPGLTASDVVHDWLATAALDRFVDNGARGLSRDEKRRFTADQLNAAIDWAWTGSYDSPGAPTNGADFVLGRTNRPLNGDTVKALKFRGAKTYAPDPLAWTVDQDAGALYGGEGDELDRTLVYQVDVPADDPSLTFSTKYDIEQGWDFGAVQVSTDGGKTYSSLANDDTTTEHNPAAASRIVEQLPGLTGTSGGWTDETFDLSDYAGQTVYLSFRYMTDAATNGNGGDGPFGWWVRDVKVGDSVVTDGTSTAGAQSATQVSPVPVDGWTVQLVGWSLDGKRVAYKQVRVKDKKRGFVAHLGKGRMRHIFGRADRIGVLVTADDPAETATKYAGYTLKLNGTVQPGGGADTGAAPRSRQLNVRIG